MIRDDIEKGYILSISGVAQYKNIKEIYTAKKNVTIELISADSAVLRKYTSANGKLCWVKKYKNYQLDGKCVEFSDGNKIETTYKEGKKNGLCKEWYGTNVLAAKMTFKNGKLHGKWTSYYYGTQQPDQIDYYKNGTWLSSQCFNKSGKMISNYMRTL